MILNKKTIFIVIISMLLSSFNAYEMEAAKRKAKSRRSLENKRTEQLKILYEHFPLYKEWKETEIYPYSDFEFLNNFDRTSVFEDYFLRKKLIENINDWLGVRYRYSGRSKRGIDCSNFTSVIIKETLGKEIPAGSATQATLFKKIDDFENLQFGDLVFFSGRNRKSKRIGHVGIYIGNGLFAHSSTGKGVIYTHISSGYYEQRYRFGGRIIKEDLELAVK